MRLPVNVSVSTRDDDDFLMTQSAVAGLSDAEAGVLARELVGQAGAHGLHLCMNTRKRHAWLHLGCLTRLQLDGGTWRGGVRARIDEALPFVDEAFRVVALEHVLEWTPQAANVLDEAVRVLAPDGILAVTGFHPFSLWLPWLLCRRRPRPMLTPPGWVRQRLVLQGVDTMRVLRCGAAWPVAGKRSGPAWAGGGFVLMARKHRAAIMPLASVYKIKHKRAGKHGAWVPGTQRECA